ncbi:MAG TPA: SGNH/GDSL hydrolase family protein, partial [Planctomycetaceae bacterium]|nr:SGNH/GDSL hydrolase family protein [Planctomycetaceae bacterium]
MLRQIPAALFALCFVIAWGDVPARGAEPELKLSPGMHITYIGNTTADRMQHHAWLETYIHALYPEYNLTFRNLGFPGDEVKLRSRSENFGTPDQWLTKTKADVVFGFFGYNEALRGEAGLDQFRRELAEMIDGMQAQKYNGKSAPELVLFSPIAHENLQSRHLPVGSENNQKLELYTRTMQEICQEKNVRFVDLFSPTLELYSRADQPLTMNGIHLLDHGNRELAKVIVEDLFGKAAPAENEQLLKLREAVLDKNYHWFSRYRVVDGYNVYGGRSKLAWFGQSNADVMMREMEIFDVKTANRDQLVWARAKGQDLVVKDDNLPAELAV